MEKFNINLHEAITLLISNGYDIIISEYASQRGLLDYFHFHKNNQFGYAQYDRFIGFSISTVHKANSKTGTGYRIVEDKPLSEITIKDFETGFATVPHWAYQSDLQSIVKFKSFEDFQKSHSASRILTEL